MIQGFAQRLSEEPGPRGFFLLGFVAYAALASACSGVDSEPQSTVEAQTLSAGDRQAAVRDVKGDSRNAGAPPAAAPPVLAPPIVAPIGPHPAPVPAVADLRPDGVMNLTDGGPDFVNVFINVTNVGNSPATGPVVTSTINGNVLNGHLQAYPGDEHAVDAFTLNPGQSGLLYGAMSRALISRCQTYNVLIDISGAAQYGMPNPLANDRAMVKTPCLDWTTPIVTMNSPQWSGTHFETLPSNFLTGLDLISGGTIDSIVSSFQVGRESDHKLCSSCHNRNPDDPSIKYRPDIARNSYAYIGPSDVISGRTWAGPDGWGEMFLARADKPTYLKVLIKTWLDDTCKGSSDHAAIRACIPDAPPARP